MGKKKKGRKPHKHKKNLKTGPRFGGEKGIGCRKIGNGTLNRREIRVSEEGGELWSPSRWEGAKISQGPVMRNGRGSERPGTCVVGW